MFHMLLLKQRLRSSGRALPGLPHLDMGPHRCCGMHWGPLGKYYVIDRAMCQAVSQSVSQHDACFSLGRKKEGEKAAFVVRSGQSELGAVFGDPLGK